MKMISVLLRRRPLLPGRCAVQSCWLLLALACFGCRREEIQVYTVPKDRTTSPGSRVTWTLPKDWTETGAGQMSVASFSIKGADGQQAQVAITPLARLAGRDAEIVNMMREQLGQEPLDREAVAKQFETVQVGGETGNLFQIDGKLEGSSGASRIFTVIVHRSDKSWFYKLAGDASLVAAQKPAFVEFLKSIRFKEAPAEIEREVSETPPAKRDWKVPGEWKELPAGQMQAAKFAVPPRGSAKAEVSVSVFPSDTGGTLANVNRWRRQIGLPEVQQAELKSMVSPLDPANPDAILVDMTNNNKRLLGAIVPRGGSYWFYKLLGDAEAVTPEKETFVAFAKSNP